ncbi:MAG TPA: hypothetical protein VMF61_09830 [Candidatus Acidoferrales bacterium]|nr:hypothetical protein [Candidatus Acidoferrales bacterium]
MRRWLAPAAIAAVLLAATAPEGARAGGDPNDDFSPCGLSGGTLTTVLTPDDNADFVVFGLYDDRGNEVAKQLIPIYSQSASAELMLTPVGFAAPIASAKCLADSPVRRCPDPQWQIDEGLMIALSGLLLGPDFAIVTVSGRYKRPSSTAQLAIDGGMAGFELDQQPAQWSAFFDSQQEASQGFFDVPAGEHTLTLGSRDAQTGKFVPQERLCFRT